MSPKQSSSLLEAFRVGPAQNNFTNEFTKGDPYNEGFSKTDASAMSSMIKSGSLDFGDLKSGGSQGYGSPAGTSDKQR
jgi:hypothetical protein